MVLQAVDLREGVDDAGQVGLARDLQEDVFDHFEGFVWVWWRVGWWVVVSWVLLWERVGGGVVLRDVCWSVVLGKGVETFFNQVMLR